MPHRIVQLTDCHLFADPPQALRGTVTRPRLTTVLDDVRRRVPDAELVALTGDTAHDESPETYLAVREALGESCQRVRIVPGNHDDRAALRAAFPQTSTGPAERVTFEATLGSWQVIGIDSQRPGESPGAIGADQLEWLRRRLESSQQHTLLLMHHPPILVGSPWLDRIGLQDAAELTRLLEAHPQVRLLCCGHVHQELAGSIGRTSVLTTPAVGPQFRPRTEELVIEPAAQPAYRVLELHADGSWRSQVLRCEGP